MSVFTGSRYADTNVYERDGRIVLKNRRRYDFSEGECALHRCLEADKLSNLAFNYYGDAQLWWVIMEANPRLSLPSDIQPGDIILVPLAEEVKRVYG